MGGWVGGGSARGCGGYWRFGQGGGVPRWGGLRAMPVSDSYSSTTHIQGLLSGFLVEVTKEGDGTRSKKLGLLG